MIFSIQWNFVILKFRRNDDNDVIRIGTNGKSTIYGCNSDNCCKLNIYEEYTMILFSIQSLWAVNFDFWFIAKVCLQPPLWTVLSTVWVIKLNVHLNRSMASKQKDVSFVEQKIRAPFLREPEALFQSLFSPLERHSY